MLITASKMHRFTLSAAIALLALGACGDDGGATPDGGADQADARNTSTPTVVSTSPGGGVSGVTLNASVGATFSEPMDPATFSAATFKLTAGTSTVAVAGTLVYGDSSIAFWPSAHLASNAAYTATIGAGVTSASGVPLGQAHTWTFTTGDTLQQGLGVNLGTAVSYAILAKSGVSTVPKSAVTGDVGVSPAAATYITGFSMIADKTNVFSTSTQVTGRLYAADYAKPTPAKLTTAIGDMQRAYTDAAGRAPDFTELYAGNIGGKTLAPGVYKWGTGLLIPTSVTLNGDATSVWIFQVAQDLTMSSSTQVNLTGNALAKNVYWQVAGKVTVGTGAHLEGVVLTQTSITLDTGASIKGRLLAQTAIAIKASTVVQPAP
jgi:hypothetical protein